ncbi:MAG: hypothetical protein ACI9VR_003566 [Cognaticolwellia sp.]|jgi:hypothetical protein
MISPLMLTALLGASAALAVSPDTADSLVNPADKNLRVRLHGELGALLPVSHTLQFSKAGTDFDLVQDGGQDNLFFFRRISADLDIGSRHTIVLLYQPLTLKSSVVLEDDLLADESTFAAGTPMNFKYGFDYTRGSYLYDFQADPERELALGLSLQIRNATIDYQYVDGSQQISNRNIGFVPIIKFRTRQPLAENAYWGFEADGFYAPVSYLNGDNNEVIGAILDTNAKVGVQLNNGVDAFASLRYIGGGSVGTNDNVTGPGDGYSKNWIQTAALSVGFSLR